MAEDKRITGGLPSEEPRSSWVCGKAARAPEGCGNDSWARGVAEEEDTHLTHGTGLL